MLYISNLKFSVAQNIPEVEERYVQQRNIKRAAEIICPITFDHYIKLFSYKLSTIEQVCKSR